MQDKQHKIMLTGKVVLTQLLALFLLALSFADHDDRIFIGEDYQSAAVEALEYDDIDFPTSVSRVIFLLLQRFKEKSFFHLPWYLNWKFLRLFRPFRFRFNYTVYHLPC